MQDVDVVQRAWADHRVWSQTANRLKGRIGSARVIGLWLTILAAVAAAGAATASRQDVTGVARALSAVAAISAGIATGVVRGRTSTNAIRDWTRARSASEGLKSEVYKRLAGSSQYSGDDPDARLAAQHRAIVAAVADLAPHTLAVEVASSAPPTVTDLASYIERRVDDQIDTYYRPRAALYHRRARRLRLAGDVLGVVAVVIAGIATVVDASDLDLATWVPVVTTIGAAVVAHIAASRYDHQIIEFLRTAEQLEDLRDVVRPSLTTAEFVDACESVISVENQAWMARWATPPDTTT